MAVPANLRRLKPAQDRDGGDGSVAGFRVAGTAALVGAIFSVGVFLRLYDLDAESLRGDEIFSVIVSRFSWHRLFTESLSAHPPFYFLVLKITRGIAGESEFVLRLPSALFGAATILPTYALGRRCAGRVTGTVAAALVAVSPALIWQAQDARPYAGATFFAALSTYFLAGYLTRRGHVQLLGYFGAAFLGFYSHYYFALVLSAQGLVVLPLILRSLRRGSYIDLGAWLLGMLFVSLSVLSRIGAVRHDLSRTENDATQPAFEALRDFLNSIGFGDPDITAWPLVLAAVLFLAAAAGVVSIRRRARMAVLVPLALLPVVFLLGGNLVFSAPLVPRHLYIVLPFWYLLAARGLTLALSPRSFPASSAGRVGAAGLAAMVGAVIAVSAASAWGEQTSTPFKQQWREVAAYTTANATARDAAYVYPERLRQHLTFYLHAPNLLRVYPAGEATCQHGRVWLIGRPGAELNQAARGLGSDCTEVMSRSFIEVRALLFEPKGGTAPPQLLDGSCGGLALTIAGTDGDDLILGTPGRDVIDAGGGDDTVAGDGGGDDVICGGAGRDTLNAGSGNDWLFGGPDDDQLNGAAGDDRIEGGEGKDVLNGGDGNDRLAGGLGDDRLNGGAGDDTLLGDEGDDELGGGDGNDVLQGGPGDDGLRGGLGHDELDGGPGNNTCNGGEGSNRLTNCGTKNTGGD